MECTANIRYPERQLTNDKEEEDTYTKERKSNTRTDKKIEREIVGEGEKKRRNTPEIPEVNKGNFQTTRNEGRLLEVSLHAVSLKAAFLDFWYFRCVPYNKERKSEIH